MAAAVSAAGRKKDGGKHKRQSDGLITLPDTWQLLIGSFSSVTQAAAFLDAILFARSNNETGSEANGEARGKAGGGGGKR